jgi:translation initiation factor IF-1
MQQYYVFWLIPSVMLLLLVFLALRSRLSGRYKLASKTHIENTNVQRQSSEPTEYVAEVIRATLPIEVQLPDGEAIVVHPTGMMRRCWSHLEVGDRVVVRIGPMFHPNDYIYYWADESKNNLFLQSFKRAAES